MTIPPASERSIHPCRDGNGTCIFFSRDYEHCRLLKSRKYFAPCDYHFTREEIAELIDHHNQQEQQP